LTTNHLIVTPIHDTYLDNGTNIGLTVGGFIIAYSIITVNLAEKSFIILYSCLTKILE